MPDAIARKSGGAAQKATAKTTTPKATMAKADPQESSAASASAGAEAPPPFVIDELAMALSSDIMLPMIEVPIPAGPGSSDPFGIMPPMLFVGYDHPLTVLDQFFGGGQSGGRTTFMDAYEGGFFRDLSIATSSDLKFITLRPTISAFAPPSPQEQAIARMFTKGIMAIGALLTPGPQDDIALAGSAAGSKLAGGANGTVSMYRAVSPAEYYDVMRSGTFRPAPGGGSLAGKQFGLKFDEVVKFAGQYPDLAAVLKVDVPMSSFSQFDVSRSIDPFIFRSGVVTVQPGAQQTLLNQTMIALEHVF